MSAMQPASFDFRPLLETDLPLVHRWHNTPHVMPWFGGARSFDDIAEEYAEYLDPHQHIRAYVIEDAGRPIGVLNWERFGDAPAFQATYGIEDPNSVNCDMLLGEADVAHRGWGATILREFLKRIVFIHPHLTSCVIDPVPDNSIAIRMYEKAGFQFVRACPEDGEGNALYLMELPREALEHPVPPPRDVYIRPARVEEVPLAVDIDDDACSLFDEIGLSVEIEETHPFVMQEVARWTEAARLGRLLFACSPEGEPVGFAVLDFVDGRPHLDQLSVQRAWMKRGIGRALVERAKAWSVRPGELWLTTYDERVPWNAPWYSRLGFVTANYAEIPPTLATRLEAEKSVLPAKSGRVAMVFRHRGDEGSGSRA